MDDESLTDRVIGANMFGHWSTTKKVIQPFKRLDKWGFNNVNVRGGGRYRRGEKIQTRTNIYFMGIIGSFVG